MTTRSKAKTIAETKTTTVGEQAKRPLEEAETKLDQLLEQEKGFRKKRWMAVIKPLVDAGNPIQLNVDSDDGVGLCMPGTQNWIELAHNGLYYYNGDFMEDEEMLSLCRVKPSESGDEE